jgi:hypothetical protein
MSEPMQRLNSLIERSGACCLAADQPISTLCRLVSVAENENKDRLVFSPSYVAFDLQPEQKYFE